MSDKPDTIDTIVDDMLNDGHTGPADSLEWIQAKMKFYAERIKDAWKRQMSQSWHHREMEELVARHEKEVAELKAVLAMRRALEELAHYDDNDANMDDPFCRDGHDCAKIARAALATINENKSDCPAPTGNASAMLTALRKLRYLASVEIANKADGIETTDLPQAILYHSQKALSEPLRNCDKFGFLDLARLAFLEVEAMPEGNDDAQMRGWLIRFIEWLFATATEQKGDRL